MYTIALCDDESEELDKVEQFLEAYREDREDFAYQTERFDSGEALLRQMRERDFQPDFLIMDIFMPGETGIDVVSRLREENCSIPVAFLTSSMEFALDAYGVDAIWYLVKPLERKRFFHVMDIACDLIQKRQKAYIMVKTAGGVQRIRLEEIVYCETQKNYQILHLKEGEARTRMTSGSMHDMLGKFRQFARCGSSYIFNVEHIVTMVKEEIQMDDGSKIYIPRNRVAEFKEKYFVYYFGEA